MIAIVVLILLVCASLSAQTADLPPCRPLGDDPSHYPSDMVRPRYPKDALRRAQDGKVEVRVVVGADGKIRDLNALNGEPEFSRAAMAEIRKWRFHPDMDHEHPVEATYKIQVRFNHLLREANSDVELESPLPEFRVTSAAPGVVAPKGIYTPEPEFSDEARKAKHQGNVGLSLVVGTDGLPQDLKVTCSSVPENNENALAAVRKWKFAPGTKDGKPVAAPANVEVSFHLY